MDFSLFAIIGQDADENIVSIDLRKSPAILVGGFDSGSRDALMNGLQAQLSEYEGVRLYRIKTPGDWKKLAAGLKEEHEKRLDLLEKSGKGKLAEYNACADEKLRELVILVDEFGDIISKHGEDAEAVASDIARSASRTGMYIVIATTRPYVDVIRGPIKSAYMTRIAFKVDSRITSRIILDKAGAETLDEHEGLLLAGTGEPLVKFNMQKLIRSRAGIDGSAEAGGQTEGSGFDLIKGDTVEYFSSIKGPESPAFDNLDTLKEFTERLSALRDIIYDFPRELTRSFGSVASDLHKKAKEQGVASWWDVERQTLTADQVLLMIVYQFWNRMDGSCEVRFAMSGKLGQYLALYRDKIMSRGGDSLWP